MRERQLDDIKDASLDRASLVTIGVFDGVHVGHQNLIRRIVAGARATDRLSVVITFFPHPDRLLAAVDGRHYLTTPERRAALLLKLGVDLVITQSFDEALRNLPAERFVDDLVNHLRIAELWVGADFALGFKRRGDIRFLREAGRRRGFSVTAIELITTDSSDLTVSSSKLRDFVRQGKMTEAKAMLGRAYNVDGVVVRGEQRGRSIGIPTANLDVWPEQVIPALGVYATWALVRGQRYLSATNIGVRPTFAGDALSIEAHILDFDGDIYGERVELQFESRLRPERKFAGLDALLVQIKSDIAAARSILEATQSD